MLPLPLLLIEEEEEAAALFLTPVLSVANVTRGEPFNEGARDGSPFMGAGVAGCGAGVAAAAGLRELVASPPPCNAFLTADAGVESLPGPPASGVELEPTRPPAAVDDVIPPCGDSVNDAPMVVQQLLLLLLLLAATSDRSLFALRYARGGKSGGAAISRHQSIEGG